MIYELREDKCIIGKVPDLTDMEIETIFDSWDKNADGKIAWPEFREGMNKFPWKLQGQDAMNA